MCCFLSRLTSKLTWFTLNSRAQQITSATVDMQRRSGSMLPPPADEYCNNGPAYLEKPTSQSPTNVRFSMLIFHF